MKCLILCLTKASKEVWILNENWNWAQLFKRHGCGSGGMNNFMVVLKKCYDR